MDFENGTKIKLDCGTEAEVIEKLGSGGQGTVYKVRIGNDMFALKWYFANKISDAESFKENLQTNIQTGSPDSKFLWPLFLTADNQYGSFGYVMKLRPKNFVDFSDILNKKNKKGETVRFASLRTQIDAAINITNAFRQLHIKGLSYQDLNDGNFFIDVNTGDVLICDNDNVAPDGYNLGINGKPGYIAPEIIRNEKRPDRYTDYYSLAVILFKLFVRHDPLMGEKFVNSVCITEKKEYDLYALNPIFIFNPNDKSNYPVKGVHFNPLKLWPHYPEYLQQAFIKSFCEGIKDYSKRLGDNEWQKLFVKLRDDLITCTCGNEMFVSKIDFNNNISTCPSCGRKFSKPMILKVDLYNVQLFIGSKLYQCHTCGSCTGDIREYQTVTGEVIQSKNNPQLWGIKNLSNDTWNISLNGDSRIIKPDSAIPIVNGATITFNQIKGSIIKQ